jgi:hypothetical protein
VTAVVPVAERTGLAAERAVTVRAVTVIMGAVVGLSFLFAFGNVAALGIRLGVPAYVAFLVAPAVDLSVVGLLLGTRYLAVYGAPAEQLRPARRLLVFSSLVTLALNVAEPLIAGQYGKAAFDAVGPLLLIGWAHVGPGLLQAMNETGRPTLLPQADVPEERGTNTSTDVDPNDDHNSDSGGAGRHPARPDRAGPDGSPDTGVDEDLVARARAEDAAHWRSHHRPISAETLRKRLLVGAATSRTLVARLRADTRDHLDHPGRDDGPRGSPAAGAGPAPVERHGRQPVLVP